MDITKGTVRSGLRVEEFVDLGSQKCFILAIVPCLLGIVLKIGNRVEIAKELTRCACLDGINVFVLRIPRPRVESVVLAKLRQKRLS